jgi:hypothetical protein
MSLKMARKSNDATHSGAPTSVMDECHMEQVKSVFEHMHNVSCMAIAAEVRISLAGVYHIFTNSLGKEKVCAKWIAHVVNNEKEPCVYFFPPPICSFAEMKAVHLLITF